MSLSKRLRGLWWNKSFRRWIAASLLLYKASLGLVSAVPDLTPVYTFQDKGEGTCMWQSNSTLVITDRPYGFDRGAEHFLYDPQSQNLTPLGGLSNSFSLLTPMNRILPPIFTSERHPDPQVSESPDGRFAVYPLAISPDAYRPYTHLNVLDRKTWQSTVISDFRINPHGTTIQWSLSSSSFVVTEEGEYGGNPIMTYVSGFADATSQMKVTQISGFSEMADFMQWDLYQVHDIDSTGQYILAEGYFRKPNYEPRFLRLMLINMRDFSYELVAEDRFFVTARFENPGDQHVFYYNSGGIFAYDRASKTRELLNDNVREINKNYWRTCLPTISPDGRFIAFDDEDGSSDVIVLPIKKRDED